MPNLKFKIINIKSLPDEKIKELSQLYHEADKTNDTRYGFQTYVNMLTKYREKDRSFVVFGFENDEMVSTTFILNIENSQFIQDSTEVREALKSEGIELSNICVPAHVFVKPEHRGKKYGVLTEKKAREAAKIAGYNYILGFGGMNETIVSFYGHIYPVSDKKKWLKVKDFMGRKISLHTL